ncbi:DUF6549 family protein [Flavobacterium sp. NRK1]|uniref:DUF6549 family protein n=1 Tax=Flavobacterium sp. NRK1 TaxID=2954929 RepID=UPI0020924D25|nr:DUF6549 family protein [Flavobacterium sp. NRK1]MCO6147536.1 hypothetical protein [Flavobacterium sp. NRK1]
MKYIWQTITVVLLVLLFASMHTCSQYKNTSAVNAVALKDTIKHYKNALGTQTASIGALQVSNKQLKNLLINKDADLKKLASEFSEVKSLITYKTVTVIDSIPIIYKDSVPFNFKRSGEIKNNWYSLAYKSTEKGVQIDSLRLMTTSAIITGYKRKWFLGAETLTTDITNSNPFISVTAITSAEVIVPVPWYKKWYVWLTAGIIAGSFAAQ